MKRQIARFIVNHEPYDIILEPHMTLIDVLRDKIGLTGTKYGCGTGSCGACTVLVEGRPVNACLTMATTVADKDIVTIEGLAEGNTLHPIQHAFMNYGAIQCGFCTPGMILSAKALLETDPNPTRQVVKKALSGNLCRCTGYVKILDAVLVAAEQIRQESNNE